MHYFVHTRTQCYVQKAIIRSIQFAFAQPPTSFCHRNRDHCTIMLLLFYPKTVRLQRDLDFQRKTNGNFCITVDNNTAVETTS
jgi:hypothetical protein